MILADTSIWIDHLRRGDARMAALLDQGSVLMHPFVIGEIACGSLSSRTALLGLLAGLPRIAVADDDEALAFIEHRGLHGRGIGYVDVHLLAAVALAGSARLWTRDRRLLQAATTLGQAADPADLH